MAGAAATPSAGTGENAKAVSAAKIGPGAKEKNHPKLPESLKVQEDRRERTGNWGRAWRAQKDLLFLLFPQSPPKPCWRRNITPITTLTHTATGTQREVSLPGTLLAPLVAKEEHVEDLTPSEKSAEADQGAALLSDVVPLVPQAPLVQLEKQVPQETQVQPECPV